jgi:uncharacterized protein YcbK (DUF882 family)
MSHGERLGRRCFLRRVSALALIPTAAVYGAGADSRSLSFVHTHTGETLSTTYFRDGDYVATSLERINHLLRDFRTEEVHAIDPTLLDLLFELQGATRHDGPFEVISAFRSLQTNATLRRRSSAVAEHSMHMEGRAIDIRLRGFPTLKLRDLAIQLQRGGVGFYAASDFVHVDTGSVRRW